MQIRIWVTACMFAMLAVGAEDKAKSKSDSKKQADQQSAKSDKAAKSKSTAASKRPKATHSSVVYTPTQPKIPDGAVEVEPGVWRHTDKDGKVWHYRRTPFGLAKWEPNPSQEPVSTQEEATNMTAKDQGETVEFETRSPFGVRKWTKKKSELTAVEQAALKRASQTKSKAAASKE